MIIRMYKKVKAILHTFAMSVVPNAPQYHKLLHSPIKKSIEYFLIVISLGIIAFTLGVYFTIIPISTTSHIQNNVINALSVLPPNSQLRIENGILTTNLNRPFYIWGVSKNNDPLLLISINEQRTSRNYVNTDALFTLARDHVSIRAKDLLFVRSYDTQTYLINSESISHFLKVVNMYAPQIQIAFYILYFSLFPLFSLAWVLGIVGLTSVGTYTLFHFLIRRVHFARCVQATSHGSIIPFGISFILFLFFPSSISTILVTPFLVGMFSLVSVYEMYFDEPLTPEKSG